jgi:hypothetical protein
MTLWYFDKSEVTAARAAPLSEEERKEREEKIAREIEFMRLKHGVTAEPEVRVRDSREAAWRDTGDGRPKPEVPGQCSAAWEGGDIIAITVPLPSGTGAGDCGVEIETTSSTLVIEAPGLEGGIRAYQATRRRGRKYNRGEAVEETHQSTGGASEMRGSSDAGCPNPTQG